MTNHDIANQLADAVKALVPEFLKDPIDFDMSKGNAAFVAIDSTGNIVGRIFGNDKNHGRGCFGIAQRKVSQVWITGYATGRFEELVYSRQLDDGQFGINRPDFIGWEGGIALICPDGKLLAAAFSGFRGEMDIEIIKKAAATIKGLAIKTD